MQHQTRTQRNTEQSIKKSTLQGNRKTPNEKKGVSTSKVFRPLISKESQWHYFLYIEKHIKHVVGQHSCLYLSHPCKQG